LKPRREQSVRVDLVEMVVFHPPQGMEDWRYYRIEYGGHAQHCLVEGGIWLPQDADPDDVEQMFQEMQDGGKKSNFLD
jgi:hypothetical protein